MKKKNWLLRLFFCSLFLLLFAFGCGQSYEPIDYSKYEYFGKYSFSGTLENGTQIDLKFTLQENHSYNMRLQVYSYGSGISYVDETGTYEMSTLNEPIEDETMQVIYLLSFHGTRSAGYVGDTILTYNGYITANLLKNFHWAYCDLTDYGATVIYFNENVTYRMRYEELTYTIVYNASTGGSILGSSGQIVKRGGNGSQITAVPDYGYAFDCWSDGSKSPTRSENNVHSDIELTAYFVESLPKYTLTYNSTTGGYVEGETSQTMFEGLDGTTVKAVPMERYGSYGSSLPPYEFLGWSDGVTTPERTDLNVQGDLTVTANFGAQWAYYGTTIEGGGNVSVSDSIANHSNNYTLTATATANEGWAFVEWSDGVKTATRTDVLTDDKTVEAIFAREIVLIAKTGGKISYNGQVDTQITALLRKPMAGDYPPIAEAVADSGYEAYGWSHYEDGHWLDSYNAYLSLNYDYPSYSVYYALFVPTEEENGGDNGDNESGGDEGNGGENSGEGETETSCNHKDFSIGAICSICKGECYVRKDTDILMYYETDGSLVAEFYGTTATNVFEVYKSQITSVYMSDSITTIKDHAFEYCNALTNIKFSNNLIEIEAYAFYGCGALTNIKFSNNLIEIGGSAFESCGALTSITIPDSVTTIGYWAFFSCYDLSEIQIGNNVRYVRNRAFHDTSWWYAQEDNSVVYLGNVCLGVKGKLPINTSVEIKADTKAIADNAFSAQGGLRSLIFPTSLTHIGGYAFANCPALLNVTSGGNVEYVGGYAFASTAFYDNKAFVDGVFYFDKVLVGVNADFSGTCTVKEGITMIAPYAFYDCDVLSTIVLPDSLMTIGSYAFYSCDNLEQCIIPKNVKEIDYYAFYSSTTVYCEVAEKPNAWDDWWNISDTYRNYWYSESEPALNDEQTAYKGQYWHYDDNGEIVVWQYWTE